jgi:hypothetical protein
MLNALTILALHDAANAHWHDAASPAPEAGTEFLRTVLRQHRANFELWHEEDRARDPEAPDARIAEGKHAIDLLNQARNDGMEALDTALLAAAPEQQEGSLHSETPGMMIDRLSILSLKIFHTADEIVRRDVEQTHRDRNRLRLETLQEQRNDLARALDDLWADVAARKRRFKLYRQMKMYNDPTLNPVLYSHKEGGR